MVPADTRLVRIRVFVTVFLLLFSPLAANAWAQTPTADPPPTAVETEVPVIPDPVPVETEAPVVPDPVQEPDPIETLPPANDDGDDDGTNPDDGDIDDPDADEDSESTPDTDLTPTVMPEVPDALEVVGDANITIEPGQYRDVVVTYTLGSDRDQTILSASMNAADNSPLDLDWKLDSVNRIDTYNVPGDPNRDHKVRLEIDGPVDNGDIVTTTWRIIAPDHIEAPVTLHIDFVSEIHNEDGVSLGVNKENFLAIHASASLHAPTVQCDSIAAESSSNTWNCAFDTDHPDAIAMSVAADVPEGWELALNGGQVTSEYISLDPAVVAAGTFMVEARYPIGCPELGAVFNSALTLTFNYPSGEASTLIHDLPLVFERPDPSLSVTSFTFDTLDDMAVLNTAGQLTVKATDVPCGWHASIEFSDLISDEFTVQDVVIDVTSVDGLPGATVSIADNTIFILAPEGLSDTANGDEFTINLRLQLPHLIPPGTYVIGLVTQLGWLDEI